MVLVLITITWAYRIQILFYEIARATQVLGHLSVSLIIPHRERMENEKCFQRPQLILQTNKLQAYTSSNSTKSIFGHCY